MAKEINMTDEQELPDGSHEVHLLVDEYETPELELDEHVVDRLVQETLRGKYGFGQARKDALGPFYDAVMDGVLAARQNGS